MLWIKSLLKDCNNDSVTIHLFLHLLTTSDGSRVVTTTLRKLAGELKTTVNKITTRLSKLESAGLIVVEQQPNRNQTETKQKGTLITLCSYDSYAMFNLEQPNRNQTETKQKPNNDKENFPPTPPLKENNIYNPLTLTGEPPLKKTPKEIFDEVVDLWHAICVDLPQVRVRNATRQKKVLCRVSEMGGYEKALPVIEDVFRTAQSISFYKGDNNRGWKASFDWFFENDTNWAKVLERVHQNGQRTYTNSNTEQARIIQERREQHLHDIERIQSDYLSKIGR